MDNERTTTTLLRPLSRRARWLLALVLLFLLLGGPLVARGGNDLFLPAAEASSPLLARLPALRQRTVTLNPHVLNPDARELRLNLFDGVTLTATRERVESSVTGGYVWIGRVAGEPGGRAILSVQNGLVSGTVYRQGREWVAVRYAGGPTGMSGAPPHVLYEIDPRAPEPSGPDNVVPTLPDAPLSVAPAPAQSCEDDGSIIDIQVAYTAAARDAMGGEAAILALINERVATMNVANLDSAAGFAWRLAHALEVPYGESGNIFNDLTFLRTQGDGILDEVHGPRDTYRADLVALLIAEGNNQACGYAHRMDDLSPGFDEYAFGVTALDYPGDYICSSLTLAHELGHNLGNAHDRAHSDSNVLFPYSYGFQSPNGTFRDIMSYDCPGGCPRVNLWANPVVWYMGEPTGVNYETDPANAADIVRSMDGARLLTANFRNTCAPPTPTPTATPTATATPTTTATPTSSPSATATPTITATATPTATLPPPTATATATPTALPTLTATPSPTATSLIPANTATPTATLKPTRRPTRTPRPTAAPSTYRAFAPAIIRR